MSTTPNAPIRVTDVQTALNGGISTNYPGGTSRLTFNDGLVRTLAGRPSDSTAISMNDMRNKAGPAAYGSLLSSYCSGSTLNQTFADGRYGTYAGTVLNSTSCAPAYGTFISQVCSGSTLVQTYADGNYGTYNVNTANSNLCEKLFIASTTNLIFNYTILRGEGGQGENFYRNTGITNPLPHRGQVWVNYFCYANQEKNWDFQLLVGNRIVARDQVSNNGTLFQGGSGRGGGGTPLRRRPGPWLEWSGVVDVNVGDVIKGYTYLWGNYGSDLIIGGYLQVGAITN